MFSLRQGFAGLFLLAICIILLPAGSFADEIIYTQSVPLSTTNWNQTITIPKFNLDAPCLESVCFELNGHVEGLAKFESLDAAPATVGMNLQATITLQRPDNTPLVTVIPLAQTSDAVTAFDGTIDFLGTSGRTYDDLSGDANESGCTVDPADLLLFTGTGNILLPVEALGTSNGSGAGNLTLQFNTSASVSITVKYTYDCTLPTEKTTWGQIKSLFS